MAARQYAIYSKMISAKSQVYQRAIPSASPLYVVIHTFKNLPITAILV